MHHQRLEDAGKNSRQIYKHILTLKEFPQSILFSEEDFQVPTALSSFTVNAPCQLPCEFTHKTATNRHTHVRIRRIVRRIRKLSETLKYILATLQDIRTSFSPTDSTNGSDDAWADNEFYGFIKSRKRSIFVIDS